MESNYARYILFFLAASLMIQQQVSYVLIQSSKRRSPFFPSHVFPSCKKISSITSIKAINTINLSKNDLQSEKETTKNSRLDGWIYLDVPSEKLRKDSPSKILSSLDKNKYKIAEYTDLLPTSYPNKPSPIQKLMIKDRIVYIKRDDLLRLEGSGVSGNKARKMLYFNELPSENFPSAIVSYGGPQSNAMLALAAMVHSKNNEMGVNATTVNNATKKKKFVYYTKKLPRWLRKTPSGNFLRALSLGMELREVSHEEYNKLFGGTSGGSNIPPLALEPPEFGDSLWIPQGGACDHARYGIHPLAMEIISFWETIQLKQKETIPLSIFVPGGTCTTAYFLHDEIKSIVKELNSRNDENCIHLDIEVVVIPCVGSADYAKRQMINLATSGIIKDDCIIEEKDDFLPKILRPKNSPTNPQGKYYPFGQPNENILKTFNFMKENDVYLDLLYGAPAWNVLLQHWHGNDKSSSRQILYCHSGGLEGISSQMTRYKQKGIVEHFKI